MPVSTKFTATYVGMVVELCGHVMECISLCGIPCLCTLSTSAFIEPSLHELDFFLKSFYGDFFLFFFDIHKNCSTLLAPPMYQRLIIPSLYGRQHAQ